MIVRRAFDFEAAHRLPGHPGKCRRLHGHSYRLIVGVGGRVDETTGMVIDFSDLKKSIKEALSFFDHKTLNDLLEYPSVENICESIKSKIAERIQFPFTLRVWEGQGKWVEM